MARLSALLVSIVLASSLSFSLTACGSQSQSAGSTGQTASALGASGATTAAASAGAPCPATNAVAFAKTRFVLHAGEAFGVFHRYLYRPYRSGAFASGAHGRLLAFAKAGAAALFIKRQVRLATEDAKANPTLCRAIIAPLTTVEDTVSNALSQLRNGDPAGIESANSAVGQAQSASAQRGVAVPDNTTATP